MIRCNGICCCVMYLPLTSALVCSQGLENKDGFQELWEYAAPREFPQGIQSDALNRPLLHVAMKNGGLVIMDSGGKNRPPKVIARLGTEQFGKLDVMRLTQKGENLYLALGDFFNAFGAPAGLAIVNVKNPKQPRVLSLWQSAKKQSGAAAVIVSGRYAYLGAMKEGVMIFDVANPNRIEPVSTFLPDVHFPRKNPGSTQHPNARGLFLDGNLLYVAFDSGGLRVLDVGDKKRPKEIGRYVQKAMAKKQQAFNDVVVRDKLAYLPTDYAGFEIVDVRNPRDIRPVGWWNPWEAHTLKNLWFNSPGHTNQIAIDWKKKLAYLSAGGCELQVISIADPSRPRLTATHGRRDGKLGAWGVTIAADRVYLAYISAVVPFRGTWSGIKALER